jgi:small subunit ribosomal protein S9
MNKKDDLSGANMYDNVIPIEDQKKQKKKIIKFQGWGKRKRSQAIAEIILGGSGKITVNKKPFHHYFANPILRSKVMIPLVLADKMANVDVNIRVVGGGVTGQLDAIVPALSKAFVKYDPRLKPSYKKTYCLLHDPRNVERKHPGYIKARKNYVFNKR